VRLDVNYVIILQSMGFQAKSFTSLGVPLLNVYASGKCQLGQEIYDDG
jgi:hypothetical protein